MMTTSIRLRPIASSRERESLQTDILTFARKLKRFVQNNWLGWPRNKSRRTARSKRKKLKFLMELTTRLDSNA